MTVQKVFRFASLLCLAGILVGTGFAQMNCASEVKPIPASACFNSSVDAFAWPTIRPVIGKWFASRQRHRPPRRHTGHPLGLHPWPLCPLHPQRRSAQAQLAGCLRGYSGKTTSRGAGGGRSATRSGKGGNGGDSCGDGSHPSADGATSASGGSCGRSAAAAESAGRPGGPAGHRRGFFQASACDPDQICEARGSGAVQSVFGRRTG